MTTTEIENLSHAELKERRAELVEAVKGAPDLAARYVQARTDAKARDEKLSEQGVTITNLNAAMESAKVKVLETIDALHAARAAGEKCGEQYSILDAKYRADMKSWGEATAVLKLELVTAAKAIAGLQALAQARRQALVTVMNFAGQLQGQVAPLLAGE